MLKKVLVASAVVLALMSSSVFAGEWDEFIKESLKQRPSESKRKTRSGKRLLREKKERIQEIDATVPALMRVGNYETAEKLFKESLRLTIELYEPDHLRVSERFMFLGILYMEARDPAKAEKALYWSLKIGEPILGEGDYRLAYVYLYLAQANYDQGKYDAAAGEATVYLMICRVHFGEDDPRTAAARDFLREIYSAQEKKK
ncbi:MAG: tetratricopeptide repeat protein [Candidatus Omnitrophota bacterium]